MHIWHDGARHAGGYRSDMFSGPGVFRWPDARRYEGEHANDKPNGYGVHWAADGSVASAGEWKDGKLVTALKP